MFKRPAGVFIIKAYRHLPPNATLTHSHTDTHTQVQCNRAFFADTCLNVAYQIIRFLLSDQKEKVVPHVTGPAEDTPVAEREPVSTDETLR